MKSLELKLQSTCPTAKRVNCCTFTYNPSVIYIHLDALELKDVPANIAMNSIYMQFEVDTTNKKIEFKSCGHVYLSPADKETPEYKYYTMRSIYSLYEKKFRKCKYKEEDDMVKKISEYYNNVMAAVIEYTGGYPYEKGI
ncbi:MAG: hypothetical protein RSE41_00410 [Clostridia bacterium]